MPRNAGPWAGSTTPRSSQRRSGRSTGPASNRLPLECGASGVKGELAMRSVVLCVGVCLAGTAFGQAPDTVFLEELTWTEVRDAVAAGTTTIIIPTGGTEQNGPHMVLGSTTTWCGTRRGRRRAGSGTRWWRR